MKIEIPSSVTYIEKFAFYGCSSLKQITIPPSITVNENGTFIGCTSLEIINIPNTVKTIGINAFYGCKSLVNIILPSSVNEIDSTAFRECTSLNKIIYKNDLKNLKIIAEIPKRLKIVLVGDTDSGKTCFVKRYVDKVFQEDTQPTPAYCTINDVYFQGNKIELYIWEVGGNEAYENLIISFVHNLSCAAVFFNINNSKSFDRCTTFFEIIRTHCGFIPLVLIGNKCDLEHNVSDEDIKELEKKYNAKFFETSAKNGFNVEKVFDYLVEKTLNIAEKNRILNLINNDE